MPKYQPGTQRLQDWDDGEALYLELLYHGWDLEPMLDLVKIIQERGLDKRLFPYTSIDKLVLTIYNDPAEYNFDELHINTKG